MSVFLNKKSDKNSKPNLILNVEKNREIEKQSFKSLQCFCFMSSESKEFTKDIENNFGWKEKKSS